MSTETKTTWRMMGEEEFLVIFITSHQPLDHCKRRRSEPLNTRTKRQPIFI
jgi:hypothetical protein